jgi:hypothetical protein
LFYRRAFFISYLSFPSDRRNVKFNQKGVLLLLTFFDHELGTGRTEERRNVMRSVLIFDSAGGPRSKYRINYYVIHVRSDDRGVLIVPVREKVERIDVQNIQRIRPQQFSDGKHDNAMTNVMICEKRTG